MRWTNENAYDAIVQSASDTYAVPAALIKAIIAAESSFNAHATRIEGGDASIGLMQLLVSTAKALGFNGTQIDLMEPGTNITMGARLLAQLLRQTGGDLDATASAYNGGYRPTLGFGARRTATTPQVCLQWKATAPATGRVISRDCQVVGSTTVGQFSNQSYVDKVADYRNYFFVPPSPLAAAAAKALARSRGRSIGRS